MDLKRPAVVLVVDDSPDYLNLLARALSPEHHVKVANSGRRALALAVQEPRPDLILLDVMMPDMDGHQVLARLREEPATSDVPVVFITSLGAASDELAALALGAADFITKPAAPAVVQARVRTQVQLKRARDALRSRNSELQAAVADLEAFSYSVSHDLRAPLQAICGFAQAVAETEGERLSERGRHRLERIAHGAKRMDHMIEDILACSRADRARLRLRSVDVKTVVEDVLAQRCRDFPATLVELDPLPTVQADPVLLRQVFDNLIGNALKFSAGAAAPAVRVECVRRSGCVELRVRDNGAGFDAAYAHKLFGLFQRLHTESEFAGTGVGLAIVKRLVTRHGGEVAADSVPGGWTTFSFTLPADCE